MQDELKKIKAETIKAQKDAILREVSVLNLHLEFKENDFKQRELKATDKEKKESLAHLRLKDIIPLKENIEFKTKYYEHLCNLESLGTESAKAEKAKDTSKGR